MSYNIAKKLKIDKENIIKTDYYIGISFSDTDLDIREYYLQRLKEVK